MSRLAFLQKMGTVRGGALVTLLLLMVVGLASISAADLAVHTQRVQAFSIMCQPPNQPSNLSPADGEEEVILTPTLRCSAFSPAEPGDTHAASQWRMTATSGDYGSSVFDTGPDSLGLLQVTLDSGRLDGNTTYYWQVRHQDNHGLWSPWSQEFTFTSQNRPPDQPSCVSPEDGASAIALSPTLRSSAFSDPDVGDSHAASQWRIAAAPADYGNPVWLSTKVTSDLTQITIAGGILDGNTTYYWQVRHQDNHGDWSEWSVGRSFTTLNRPPDRPAPVSPPSGATGTSLSLTLESSAFSDPDSGDVHAASQWQIITNKGDCDSPAFHNTHESGLSLTSITVTACSLNPGTTYYWRVRYQDNHGAWSEWSEEASFTTESTPPVTTENRPPDRPVCLTPEDGATGVSTSPTLESSSFRDPDVGDSQAASQWQMTTTSGDYHEPTVDRLESLNSIVFPDEMLSPDTTYYWRVRYQDSHEAWSEWSEESSFTTEAEVPSDTGEETAMTSWIYLGAIVAVAVLATAAVIWRNARAARMATE